MDARDLLLDLLDEAYDKTSWHGPNLRGALRGLKASDVDWRPAAGRHSIRELAVHAAYWKFRIRRRLTGQLDATFPLPGKNWFRLDASTPWASHLTLLANEHAALRKAIASFPVRRLHAPIVSNGATAAYLMRGIAAHDLYHTGQIALLKRMVRSR